MKPENHLKKAAKAERRKILENGGDLLATLEAQIVPKKKKRRVAVWLSVAASSLAVIISAVCIGIFYPRTEEEPPVYFESNTIHTPATLEDANEISDEFLFVMPEALQFHGERAEDSVSGDTLCFEFQLFGPGTPFLYANIFFLCNPAYHYLNMETDFTHYETVETDDYRVYFQNAATDPLFPGRACTSGFIFMGDESVHIAVYEEVSSTGTADGFIDFVQDFIRKK